MLKIYVVNPRAMLGKKNTGVQPIKEIKWKHKNNNFSKEKRGREKSMLLIYEGDENFLD